MKKCGTKSLDRFRRIRTGAKGIGRFAKARRLGTSLTLESTAKADRNQKERTEVTFDWLAFQPGKDLTEVPSTYRRTLSRDGRNPERCHTEDNRLKRYLV